MLVIGIHLMTPFEDQLDYESNKTTRHNTSQNQPSNHIRL